MKALFWIALFAGIYFVMRSLEINAQIKSRKKEPEPKPATVDADSVGIEKKQTQSLRFFRIKDKGYHVSVWPNVEGYQGINYMTGEPANDIAKTYSVEVPSSYIGTIGHLTASYYGFSGVDEWTADITVTANSTADVLGTVTVQNVPFKRNRITEYHGNIFGSSGGWQIGVNDTWDESYTDTW